MLQTTVSRLSKKFLKEIKQSSTTVEGLNSIIEVLESKNDPDPSELYLLESLYNLRKNLVIVESKLNTYLEKTSPLLGNKLYDLYDRSESHGTSKLFND